MPTSPGTPGGPGGPGVFVLDEGIGGPQFGVLDFTGAGVTVTDDGTRHLIDIPGGAGSGDASSIQGANIPDPGAPEDGFTWVYDSATDAMVWTDPATFGASGLAAHVADTTDVHGILDVNGYPYTAKTTAPSNASIANGTGLWYHDATAGGPVFKGKTSGGTVVSLSLEAIYMMRFLLMKGEMFVGSSGSFVNGAEVLGVGSNDTLLVYDSTQAQGFRKEKIKTATVDATLKPSGSAAAGTESLRALGTTASTAAAGNDARLSDSRGLAPWIPLSAPVTGRRASGGSALTNATFTPAAAAIASGTNNPAVLPISINTDLDVAGKTTEMQVRMVVYTNGTATAITFTAGISLITASGGGTDIVAPTWSTPAGNTAVVASPAINSIVPATSTAFTRPTSGEYLLTLTMSGAMPALATALTVMSLWMRHV